MGAAIARTDESAVDLPREVWSKGKRPVRGVMVRLSFALTLLLVGLLTPMLPVRIALIVLGVGSFFAVPPLVDAYLERLGAKLGAASKSEATKLLEGLEARRWVALFAPHAWVSLQKGRLHMILRDGRAAAINFAEAARQLGNVEQPALLAAQAQGYVLSGDRKLARELLVKLEERDQLRPRDRVHLGIVYVEEPGKTRRALEHLQEAQEVLGDDPQVQAALALAHARAGEPEDAARWADAAESNEALDDDVRDLLKRARKDLRGLTEKKGKPGKKKKASEAEREPAEAPRKETKRSKKDRRKERREKRGKKKAAPARAEGPGRDAEAEQREAEKRAAERREAEKRAAEAEKRAAEAEKRAAEEREAEESAAEKRAAEERAAEQREAQKRAAEKPVPPPVRFEGPEGKPVFRAPVVPPPPVVKAPEKAAPPSAPTSDGWDDLLGDD
jgi:hypothetical protein